MAIQPSAEKRGIISAGTWTLDRVKIIDAWPQEEHLAEIIATDMQGGGSGYNLAVDIRQLDPSIPVEAIGLLGEDVDGEFLRTKAHIAGIDTSQLHSTGAADTSFTEVMSDTRTGRRTFFHHRGTSDLLTPEHFDFNRCQGRILHLGLLGLHKALDSDWQGSANGWQAVLKKAKAAGLQTNLELVSISPQHIFNIASPCLAWLDSLIVNEYEVGALAQMATTDSVGKPDADRCLAAAKQVLSRGSMSLVVVHYPKGAIALTADGRVVERSSFQIPENDIKSAVGAGDAFAAGILYGLHENRDLDTTMELAHAAAAASLRASTTVGAVESIEACLAFARSANRP